MMDWQPAPQDSLPLYQQIKQYILAKIKNGEWPAGSRLPAQRALAERFAVNRSTLITALADLVADGVLAAKPGSGIWVANSTWSLFSARSSLTSMLEHGPLPRNFPTIQRINEAEFKPGLLRLGTGELGPDLIPAEAMTELLKTVAPKITAYGYEEPKGLLALRTAISRYVQSFDIQASPASILIVSGAQQALQLITACLLPPSASILLETPSYLFSFNSLPRAGIKLHGLPLDQHGPQLAALQQHSQSQTGHLFYTIPCFHNPTGIVMSAARRAELLAMCQDAQLPLIEDDVYRELWLDEAPPPPLKAYDQHGQVLYLGSLSKSLSPGLRIGWLIGPEPVIERLADAKMQYDYGSSVVSQWLAAEWLNSPLYQEHLTLLRAQLRQRRAAMLTALQQHMTDLGSWTEPRGGFYIWLTLHKGISLPRLFKLAQEHGLLINPGNLYDPLSSHHIRLSYAYATPEQLAAGIQELANVIQAARS